MAGEGDDLWQALQQGGESIATEEDYEHGYKREVRGDLRQYVAFRVSGEVYGLAIPEIAEISKPLDTTPVPRTADFVLGIGNIRGSVIPIIDLARRLRLQSAPRTPHARVLIVRHSDELHGLMVDRVLGVVPIPPEDLEEAPGAIAGARGEFIQALARHEGEILIVLDLGALLDPRDFVAASTSTLRSGAVRRSVTTTTNVGPRQVGSRERDDDDEAEAALAPPRAERRGPPPGRMRS